MTGIPMAWDIESTLDPRDWHRGCTVTSQESVKLYGARVIRMSRVDGDGLLTVSCQTEVKRIWRHFSSNCPIEKHLRRS